jgi:hypothetical protein
MDDPFQAHDDASPTPRRLRRSSSDYLLLTETSDAGRDVSIPRPKAFLALPILASLDLITAIVFTVLVGMQKIPGCAYLLILNYLRSLVVLRIGLHARVREMGWMVAACSLVSLLKVLSMACSGGV